MSCLNESRTTAHAISMLALTLTTVLIALPLTPQTGGPALRIGLIPEETIFERLAGKRPRVREELVILASSAPVPSNGLLIRHDLAPALRRRLREALVGMHQDPAGRGVLAEFGAQRFLVTEREDYAPVHDLTQRAGIPLAVGPVGEQ